ncbi:MAG: hypothetical protein K2N48_06785 [Muribaculaceae bacterium]|nr:hypothetical protein [Muribaculaceae bacterium]
MKKDTKKIYDDYLDLEDILSPRCEFKVSSGFKERVMSEALSIPKHRRYRLIPYLTATVAAAAATIVIITALHFIKTDTSAETPNITAAIENKTPIKSDTLQFVPELLADTPPAQHEKERVAKSVPAKKKQAQKSSSARPVFAKDSSSGNIQPVTEGEMPMVNKERSLDPDEVRNRMLDIRRNAEIAYIESIRDEIDANQAYIAQLMTE